MRAYATNETGTAYGQVETFTTITENDIDNDGDGYSVNQGDCDDNEATVYPGATELEDGIDNNCDGVIDEGFDVDGDGYSVSQGDCDDNDETIYPGATEQNDGIDNDCDGEIDEGFDMDGDGYSVGQGDCDDTNSQFHPGRVEIEDGIDNDCDGDIDEGIGTFTGTDGNSYNYLTYGTQVWTVETAENVTYRDGTPIPQVTNNTEWANLTTGAWCYYNNDPTKPRLYNWYAVAGIHDTDPNTPNKEFAPEGWHVPTRDEGFILINYLSSNGYNYDGSYTGNKIGKAMASTSGWNTSTNNGAVGNNQNLNNSSGFNAIPTNSRSQYGVFGTEGWSSIWWSSGSGFHPNSIYATSFSIVHNYFSNGYSDSSEKVNGYSVRFVRN